MFSNTGGGYQVFDNTYTKSYCILFVEGWSCIVLVLVTLGGGWGWRIPGCMCEWMFGGMCAGVVCEDMLFCTMSVLRNVDMTLGGGRDW